MADGIVFGPTESKRALDIKRGDVIMGRNPPHEALGAATEDAVDCTSNGPALLKVHLEDWDGHAAVIQRYFMFPDEQVRVLKRDEI